MKNLAIKIVVSLTCVIVLVLLFFFGDEILSENSSAYDATQNEETYRDAFIFDPEEMKYDGTGELDLLEGVSLKG